MNPFKPSQTLTQIKDLMWPEVQAIVAGYPGVFCELSTDDKRGMIVLKEWKEGFTPLYFSTTRAQLENAPYMAAYPDQVSGLAVIVQNQVQTPMPPALLAQKLSKQKVLSDLLAKPPKENKPPFELGQIIDAVETSVEGTRTAPFKKIFDGSKFVILFSPEGDRVVNRVLTRESSPA